MSWSQRAPWHRRTTRKWSRAVPWTSRNLLCPQTSPRLSPKTSIRNNLKPQRKTKSSWRLKTCNLLLISNCNRLKQCSRFSYHQLATSSKMKILKRKTFTIASTCRKESALITTFQDPCRPLTSSIRRLSKPSIAPAVTTSAPSLQSGISRMLWNLRKKPSFKCYKKKSRKMLMKSSVIIF